MLERSLNLTCSLASNWWGIYTLLLEVLNREGNASFFTPHLGLKKTKTNPKKTPPHPKSNQLPLQKSCQNLWNASICENIVFQEYKILYRKSMRRDADCVSWISFFFTSNSVCRKSFCLCVEYHIISVKNNQKNPEKNITNTCLHTYE